MRPADELTAIEMVKRQFVVFLVALATGAAVMAHALLAAETVRAGFATVANDVVALCGVVLGLLLSDSRRK